LIQEKGSEFSYLITIQYSFYATVVLNAMLTFCFYMRLPQRKVKLEIELLVCQEQKTHSRQHIRLKTE
jgi:hypothetical protein